MKKEFFKLQSEICKTLSSPKRLEIIYILKDGEKTAGQITEAMGLNPANVSQHLSVLKACGVVRARRDGVNICYSIANPKIVKACALMREVLLEQMEERSELARSARRAGGRKRTG